MVELQLADLTHPSVLGEFGITGEISAGSDYSIPQLWGAALRAAGFDGIRYVARHDPAFEERNIAVFGAAGEQARLLRPVKEGEPAPISEELLQRLQDRFRIFVVPTTGLG